MSIKTEDIRIRDPFVIPVEAERAYYLFGTTDVASPDGKANGIDCYKSRDLLEWSDPLPAFRPSAGFWATRDYWAPEVHAYQGRYYMLATFKADKCYRGTQVLASDVVSGPYEPLTGGPVTPSDWECLDGTLHLDQDGSPWMVFCHEWVQVHNGGMYALPLSPDLRKAVGRPVFLFNASEAPWVRRPAWPGADDRQQFPSYVTDGPWLHRLPDGALIMLWSSMGANGYAMGIARSESAQVTGPWRHEATPLWAGDGGHSMIFQAFEGRRMLAFHRPNHSPDERAVFVEIEEFGESIGLKNGGPSGGAV